MKTEDLNYQLPAELIAQTPADRRTNAKLLIIDRVKNTLTDERFANISQYLRPGDCLVLNNTKVLPARFFAARQSGAKLEGLFLEQKNSRLWLVMLKNARRLRISEEIRLLDRGGREYLNAGVVEKLGAGQWLIQPETAENGENVLKTIGFSPLPPYIKRPDPAATDALDKARYQTVYAACAGAVAAPTAGMHFSEQLLDSLAGTGIKIARLTLHVGIGTFKPVEAESLDEHKIHSEKYSINHANAEIINGCSQAGGRIIAVGTTSVRTLETVAAGRKVAAGSGSTELFIKPGYKFKIVDGLITNFHLPKSTLIALVAAFAGLDEIMAAYAHAIKNRYRFYSYGDAMLIV